MDWLVVVDEDVVDGGLGETIVGGGNEEGGGALAAIGVVDDEVRPYEDGTLRCRMKRSKRLLGFVTGLLLMIQAAACTSSPAPIPVSLVVVKLADGIWSLKNH